MSKGGCINRGRNYGRTKRKDGTTFDPKPGALFRQERAAERQAHRDGLHPAAQLAALDRRLGKGRGAARERARLAKALSKAA